MPPNEIANAAFATLLAVDGKPLRTTATSWDGERLTASATPDEMAATARVRFTGADGLLLCELPLQCARSDVAADGASPEC